MKHPAFATLDEAFRYCRDMDASLNERLEAFSEATRYLIPGYQEAVDRMVGRFKSYDAGQTAPKPGEKMPPFAMPDEQGHLVTLDALLSDGPLAMTFHRGHWCPYCRINTRALAEAQEKIAADGAHLAAIMPDRQHFAAAFKAEGEVLPDPDRHRQWLCAVAEPRGVGRRRDAGDLGIRGPGRACIPGQPNVGHAHSCDFCGRPRRGCHRPLHRPGLSQSHDDRGLAGGPKSRAFGR